MLVRPGLFRVSSVARFLGAFLLAGCACSSQVSAQEWNYRSACSWNNPGGNKYQGKPEDALSSFPVLTYEQRDNIRRRLVNEDPPDDVVQITRNEILSSHGGESLYYAHISDMHFGGQGQVCIRVDRQRWPADKVELADVWCEGTKCFMLPRVCGNPSLISRSKWPKAQPAREPILCPASIAASAVAGPQCPTMTVSEPSTVVLVGVALAGILYSRRRKAKAKQP